MIKLEITGYSRLWYPWLSLLSSHPYSHPLRMPSSLSCHFYGPHFGRGALPVGVSIKRTNALMLHQGANSLPNASEHQDIKNKSDKRGTARSWKLCYSAVQRSSLFTVNIPVANSRASPPNSTASSNTITVKVRANRKRTGQAAKSASRSDWAALHKLTSLTSPFRKWILTEGQLIVFLQRW